MVGTHGDLVIGAPFGLAAALLGQKRGDQFDHVGAAFKMLVLIEGTGRRRGLARDVAQVDEMDARSEFPRHRRQVVVAPRPQRARAQRHPVHPQVDLPQHMGIVVAGGQDARQPQQRPRRIVGMGADVDSRLLGHRRRLFQEIDQMAAQPVRVDALIAAQLLQQLVQRIAVGRAGQARADVAAKLGDATVGHVGETPRGLGGQSLGVILGSARALQDMDVEGHEVRQVEPHRPRALARRPAQVGAGPVQHRHEVVADRADAAVRQPAQRFLPIGDMGAPVAGLGLDVLADGDAFDHLPFQPAGAHLVLALADALDRPGGARGHMMQGGDDALHPGLHRVLHAYLVHRTEPAPGVSHVSSPANVSCTLQAMLRSPARSKASRARSSGRLWLMIGRTSMARLPIRRTASANS